MAGQGFIILAIVNLGLFVAAAGLVLLSAACDKLAHRYDTPGWHSLASATRWLGGALTLLLILAVLGTALSVVVAMLRTG